MRSTLSLARHISLLCIAATSSLLAHDYVTATRADDTIASFTSEEAVRYASIGRVECLTVRNTIFASTAFHAGGYRTMIANAHAFVDRQTKARLDPLACMVRFYDPQGAVREELTIVAYRSRWDVPGRFYDPSDDIAVMKLSGESRTTGEGSDFLSNYKLRDLEIVTMVGFRGDLGEGQKRILRRSWGQAQFVPPQSAWFSEYKTQRTHLARPTAVVAANYNAAHGTSGSPVYNSNADIIGMNVGYYGSGKYFDRATDFNYFLLLDRAVIADIRSLLAS